MQDLLLLSWASKTQTSYNSHIRKWLKYCTKEGILDPYMDSYDQKCNFYPTFSMRQKESMGQLQLHTLPFQLFCQKLMGKHLGRMTALAG